MSFTRAIQQPEIPSEDQRSSAQCIAYGCPMPGVFSPQMRGKNFLCSSHDGTPSDQWGLITQRIRQYEKALIAAIELSNALSWSDPDERYVRAFVRNYGEKFERRKRHFGLPGQKVKVRGEQWETARDYGQRLYLLLLDIVRADIAKEAPVDLKAIVQDTWQQATVDV